jgi:hypothetical protein
MADLSVIWSFQIEPSVEAVLYRPCTLLSRLSLLQTLRRDYPSLKAGLAKRIKIPKMLVLAWERKFRLSLSVLSSNSCETGHFETQNSRSMFEKHTTEPARSLDFGSSMEKAVQRFKLLT